MTDLNTIRRLGGLPEVYVGEGAEYSPKGAPASVQTAIHGAYMGLIDDWEKTKSPDLKRLYRGDANDWKAIDDLAKEGNHEAAQKAYASMDTDSRDRLSKGHLTKSTAQEVAEYFGFTWNTRFMESMTEDCQNCGGTGMLTKAMAGPDAGPCPKCDGTGKKDLGYKYRKSESNPYGTEGNGYDDARLDHDEDEEGYVDTTFDKDKRRMDGAEESKECPTCHGYGEDTDMNEPCKTCGGSGQRPSDEDEEEFDWISNKNADDRYGPVDDDLRGGEDGLGPDGDGRHDRQTGDEYPEDEEANFKSSLNKGQHVEYNGETYIVVVPDAQADFIGIAPVGQEEDPDAVEMVHARKLMNKEDEEVMMDINMDGEDEMSEFEPKTNICPECEGDGARYGDTCPTCNGHGEIHEGYESHGALLAKVAKVIKSVKSEAQYNTAVKYAKQVAKTIKTKTHKDDLPMGVGHSKLMSTFDALDDALKQKASEFSFKAQKVFEGASTDATVWDAMDHDKDESPESPTDDSAKIKVPANVKAALNKEIKELEAEAEKLVRRDNARSAFYQDCADAMNHLIDDLDGTVRGLKKAQIFMTSLMSPIVQRIPDVAHDFITRGGEPESLKSLFSKAKAKK